MTAGSRILITGGAGFIGAALCEAWLARGATVLAFDDLSARGTGLRGIHSDRLQVVQGRVEDAGAIRHAAVAFRPEQLYHLAALHYIPACNADPVRTLHVNVAGTEAVLLAAAAARVERLVFASTASVYAPSTEPHTEDDPVGPRDVYGLSKAFAEELCRHFCASSQTPTTLCRLFNVYGPGDTTPHIIPEILKQLDAEGEAVRLGNVSPRRDFVALSDAVAALVAVTQTSSRGLDLFNVGAGQDSSIEELVDQIGAAIGKRLTILPDPSRMRRTERARLAADVSKLRATGLWQPRTSLAEGIGHMVAAHERRRPAAGAAPPSGP